LSVKGRLLKDRARLAPATAQGQLFGEAAQAYAAANRIEPSPYLGINAASLLLLSGNPSGSREAAIGVLAQLDAPEPPADTPYYLAATRAEARLLLGDENGAQCAMAQASLADPDGWHDRAGTIAQLREVANALSLDTSWIAEFAPPASLHFAGHIGFAADGASERQLNARLDRILAEERIGFAWGALAAGADLIIAERLIATGCTVHAVLPCPLEMFEAQSVSPAGPQWQQRFRTAVGQVASLRCAGEDAASAHDPLATAHAGELAIGGALLHARTLSAPVLQLIVVDEQGGGLNTAAQARMWRPGLGRQLCLAIPRDLAVEALFPPEQPDPARVLAVHAAIAVDGPIGPVAPAVAEVLAMVFRQLPEDAVRPGPGRWEFSDTDVDRALSVLIEVQRLCRAEGVQAPAIGAHLAICHLAADPASGIKVAYGASPALALRLQAMAPAGAILASDDLAVALAARGVPGVRTELFHFGEAELGGAVHLLLPRLPGQ
jgi:hypothetical protein